MIFLLCLCRQTVNGNRPTNPPSGTVVDDVVTLPERYDFFLISQSVRQVRVGSGSFYQGPPGTLDAVNLAIVNPILDSELLVADQTV